MKAAMAPAWVSILTLDYYPMCAFFIFTLS